MFHQLIERFTEDVDLVIDRRTYGARCDVLSLAICDSKVD